MLKKPQNENYAANVVKIDTLIPLDNCDNVQHASIYGNLVIVSKEVKKGDMGIFFPVETRIENEFLHHNNLHREGKLNKDQSAKGFFEDNGRVKAITFRGHNSAGFFIPLTSLAFTGYAIEDLKERDCFDELNGKEICRKYFIKKNHTPQEQKERSKKGGKTRKVNILIDGQFKLHVDTAQLGKNVFKIKQDTLISITNKLHGTSFVSSNILCKKPLSFWDNVGKKLGFSIVDTEYKNIYSSRKVIKNSNLTEGNHYYSEDVWGKANDKIKDLLSEGMTVYGEIVGYTTDGKMIQKGYDYGCQPGTFEIYIYRITETNIKGKVFEYSAKQVQLWCNLNGIKAVPEFFYGRSVDLLPATEKGLSEVSDNDLTFQENFMAFLKKEYLEKPCSSCAHDVPDEGIVLRIEDTLDIEPFKLKSFSFLKRETKMLDSGEGDIESDETESET